MYNGNNYFVYIYMYDIHLVQLSVKSFNIPLDLITCTEGHYHIYMYLCDKWAMSHVYKQYIK